MRFLCKDIKVNNKNIKNNLFWVVCKALLFKCYFLFCKILKNAIKNTVLCKGTMHKGMHINFKTKQKNKANGALFMG